MTLVPARSGGNAVSIDGVTVTGTPSAGQSIVATSATAAHWAASAAPPGGTVVRAFPISFNTAGLSTGTGHTIYTPAAGDVILDVWVATHIAWNGTTPFGDVGTASGGLDSTGIFGAMSGPLDMTHADGSGGTLGTQAHQLADAVSNQAVSMGTTFNSSLYQVAVTDVDLVANATGNGESGVPAVCDGLPVKVWVTQGGHPNDADPGATQGSATVYLVTATPV